MAKITIIVQDLDLDSGTYAVNFEAEGSEIDEGVATAAYFTGYYLYTLIEDEKFIADLIDFADVFIKNMEKYADEPCLSATEPVVARLTLVDKDLNTGRYEPKLEWVGHDPDGKLLPTTAQCMSLYMRSLLQSIDFQNDCWEFARNLVAENDSAVLTNAEHAPAINDDGAQPKNVAN